MERCRMKALAFSGAALALVAAVIAFFSNPLLGFLNLSTAAAMAATGVVHRRQQQKRRHNLQRI